MFVCVNNMSAWLFLQENCTWCCYLVKCTHSGAAEVLLTKHDRMKYWVLYFLAAMTTLLRNS